MTKCVLFPDYNAPLPPRAEEHRVTGMETAAEVRKRFYDPLAFCPEEHY
jgi:hypothetical protein